MMPLGLLHAIEGKSPCARASIDIGRIDLQWFAAEDEGRTEEPSETKLRKAREDGSDR